MTHYFIFAGETSGDLHGSRLIQSLYRQEPRLTFSGVGGPLMRKEGLNSVLHMEDFQVMGFTDVIKALPRLWRHFKKIRHFILKEQPACVILIDYPGFNLRLAASLRKKGYAGKIIQYIAPTVWAHGKSRIQTLADSYDLLLTIFPFESTFFSKTGLNVQYIGNPLVDRLANYSYQEDWKEQYGIPENQPLIALFPGSRPSELSQHLSLQLETAVQLKKKDPSLIFALSQVQPAFDTQSLEQIAKSPLTLNKDLFIIPKQFSYELMRDCRAALAKSGTVTLELALHETPTLVMYQLSSFNYFMAKYVLRLKLPYYCIVNILKGKQLYPEVIGKNLSIIPLLKEMETIYSDVKVRQQILTDCHEIKIELGQSETSHKAAKAILEVVKC